MELVNLSGWIVEVHGVYALSRREARCAVELEWMQGNQRPLSRVHQQGRLYTELRNEWFFRLIPFGLLGKSYLAI